MQEFYSLPLFALGTYQSWAKSVYQQSDSQSRKHFFVNKDPPEPRPIQPAEMR